MEDFLIPVYIFGLILFIVFWIWALVDLASSNFKKTRWKLAWLLVILFFPLVGSLLYLLLRKEFKAKRRRRFRPQFKTERHLE